jgi:hypothetical protein
MVTGVKLESTVLYIIPIFAETLEVCGSIHTKKGWNNNSYQSTMLWQVIFSASHRLSLYVYICWVQCALSFRLTIFFLTINFI